MKRVHIELLIAIIICVWSVYNWFFFDFAHAFLPLTISGIIQTILLLAVATEEPMKEGDSK